MKSILRTHIFHRRDFPKKHMFTYKGMAIRFDIDKVNELKIGLFGVNRFNLWSLYFKDHGFRDGRPLKLWAKEILRSSEIDPENVRIELQTYPRFFGYVFNPVSFWYCYKDHKNIAVICEVSNTFCEHHTYVVNLQHNAQSEVFLPKEFHVSPFFDVSGDYRFEFTRDKAKVDLYKDNECHIKTFIQTKEELEWSNRHFLLLALRFPFLTLMLVIRIHIQALQLFIKKIPFHKKPEHLKEMTYDSSK